MTLQLGIQFVIHSGGLTWFALIRAGRGRRLGQGRGQDRALSKCPAAALGPLPPRLLPLGPVPPGRLAGDQQEATRWLPAALPHGERALALRPAPALASWLQEEARAVGTAHATRAEPSSGWGCCGLVLIRL